MTQHFLYLPDGPVFLAQRCLRAYGADARVCILHAPTAAEAARGLVQAHACAVEAIPLDDSAPTRLAPMLARAGDPEPGITAILQPDLFPLAYQYPVQIPDFRPQAALLYQLWSLGFRRFETAGPTGNCALPLTHVLPAFKNQHQGKRCFIIGNGPSLNAIDMTRLRDEITFSSNRAYLGYEHWGFQGTYWGIYDPLQIEKYCDEYEAQVPDSIIKFVPMQYAAFLRMKQICPLLLDWPRESSRQFSTDPERLFVGYSVTYMLLQAAAVMGCDPIILVGMDHRYTLNKQPGLTRMLRLGGRWAARHYDQRIWYRCALAAWREYVKRRGHAASPPPSRLWRQDNAQGPTHFDQRYTSEKREFLMPRPADAEADYRCALAWAQQQDRRILNATPDSALDVFPKVAYDSLF